MTAAARDDGQGGVRRVSERGARIAAGIIGCTVEDYRQHESADEFWCGINCHWVPASIFQITKRGTRGGRCTPCRRRPNLPPNHRPCRFSLTPEGVTASSPASGRCGPTPAVAPSGHIYRPVDVLDPVQAQEVAETSWRMAWSPPGLPGGSMILVGAVTRDGQRREERPWQS